MFKRKLPEPEVWADSDVVGNKLIKPIDGYAEKGEQVTIVDIYEPIFIFGEQKPRWKWRKRVKQYNEPHRSKESFDDCEYCKDLGRKYGETKPDEIICEASDAEGLICPK